MARVIGADFGIPGSTDHRVAAVVDDEGPKFAGPRVVERDERQVRVEEAGMQTVRILPLILRLPLRIDDAAVVGPSPPAPAQPRPDPPPPRPGGPQRGG